MLSQLRRLSAGAVACRARAALQPRKLRAAAEVDELLRVACLSFVQLQAAWDRADLALQWLSYAGSAGTVYYAVPQQQTVQLVLRVYL